MKRKRTLVTAVLGLFLALAMSTQLAAQTHHHYKLIDMGTFGGPRSYVLINLIEVSSVLNNRGTVAGWADTSTPDPSCFNEDCFVSHAFQSQNGVLTDLGVLPGGRSSQANWISANGLIVGLSQNGLIDPLVTGLSELRAVLWQNGGITDLGTLPEGGYESKGQAVNSRGQVAGVASNTVPDRNSMFGIGYESRAFLWQEGIMQDLGTLGSGTDAQAVLINESGQVSGWSYINSTPTQAFGCMQVGFPLTTGSFIWQQGKMTDLGNFGGTCTLTFDLNERGQVAGFSYFSGDVIAHPFLWERGVLRDLGTLGGSEGTAAAINDGGDIAGYTLVPGDLFTHGFLWRNGVITDLGTVGSDPCSFSFAINSKRQVLGFSGACDVTAIRGTLSEDGEPMVDLNTLVPSGSSLYLTIPITINERGDIAGVGNLANGDQHAFVLIPCDEHHPGVEGCDYSLVDESATAAVNAIPPKQMTATVKPGLRFGLGRLSMRPTGLRSTPWYRGFRVQQQK